MNHHTRNALQVIVGHSLRSISDSKADGARPLFPTAPWCSLTGRITGRVVPGTNRESEAEINSVVSGPINPSNRSDLRTSFTGRTVGYKL